MGRDEVLVRTLDGYDALTKEDRDALWHILDEISRNAMIVAARTPPTVPSRQEIHAAITAKRASSSTTSAAHPSMSQAFLGAFNKIAEITGSGGVTDHAAAKSIMQRWAAANSETVSSGETVLDLCHAKDLRAIAAYSAHFPDLNMQPSHADSLWPILAQLSTFSTFGNKIPPNMMSRIEDVASRLASDIAGGNANLASLDLNDIGRQVIAGVDPTDVSSFSQNLDAIMPALANFRPT